MMLRKYDLKKNNDYQQMDEGDLRDILGILKGLAARIIPAN